MKTNRSIGAVPYLRDNRLHQNKTSLEMLKDLIAQKGWIGKTISRAETIDRLNPIIEQHIIVNRSYDSVIGATTDQELQSALEVLQKTARVNVSKVAETIYSCGGVAFNGTQLEPDDFKLGGGVEGIAALIELDEALLDRIKDEGQIEHQMRTKAILGVLSESTTERINTLTKQSKRVR